MKTNLDKIDELAETLKALQPLKPDYQKKLDKKFRLEFNYNSNHLEGNTLTYGETELLLIFDDTTGNHTMREYEEMKAHDVAYQLVEDWAKDTERPLTEQNIKNLNEIILVRPFWKDAITPDGQNTRRQIKVGEYKEFHNSVRLANGELFAYASPIDTPYQVSQLIAWYRAEAEKVELPPVALAALLHYKFVRIHPFDDGNGRIARLLTNYVLLKARLPPVIIKSADKRNYLTALNRADAGDLEAFVHYIALQLIWSLELAIKAAKGEDIREQDDYAKEIELLSRKVSTAKVPKSPAVVYDLFNEVSTQIWPLVDSTLQRFDALFTESRTTHHVNRLEEKYETSNSLINLFEKSTKPKEKKIFGHNIYDRDIKTVKWLHSKYGLQGAGKNTNYEIVLDIYFEDKDYMLSLFLNGKKIAGIEKSYNDFVLTEGAREMNKALQAQMLDAVKNDIEDTRGAAND